MKLFPDLLLTLLLPTLVLVHLYLAPYTKVEESFNLQAAHDILTYGVPTEDVVTHLRAEYDHMSFPGAVPRTFVGALVLAAQSKLGIWLGIDRQLVVRGVLGLFNALMLLSYRSGLAKAFGRGVGNWFMVLLAGQFHVIYYASRTLPNMFAFGLSTIALRQFLPTAVGPPAKRHRLAIYLLTFTGVVFRSELALLLAAQVAYLLFRERTSLSGEVIPAGVGGGLIGLLVTVPIDSFFWARPLWPELSGLLFNVVEGKAADWGTSPWHFYFANAVPRLLMNPMSWQLCIPMALGVSATRGPALDILAPLLAFIAAYSVQAHKEWRFIVYAVPGLTAAAALGANWIWTRRAKSPVYRTLSLMLLASTLGSLVAATGMLAISRLNYPGAVALARVHALGAGSRSVVRVHMDALACSTGVTRFLEKEAAPAFEQGTTVWLYDKTEDPALLAAPAFWDSFDYVLTEAPQRVPGDWVLVEEVRGYAGLAVTTGPSRRDGAGERPASEKAWDAVRGVLEERLTGGRWVQVKMEPKLAILKRARERVEAIVL
ncbi:MAG: dolichyl-P-Man:Man(7)GlcNAc(2)-PP-dolichol alpha-1,6-mannosyltransferase [Thelocarpon impressellum]|nr:MAG: dolichyl-P-Man:Man(7)GlcNAc(2)-PP-dolichol alpha-1,6-mannosyltransferase [Thelocarpon impressellum]